METTASPNFNDEKMAGFNLHMDSSLMLGGGGERIFLFISSKIVGHVLNICKTEMKIVFLFGTSNI